MAGVQGTGKTSYGEKFGTQFGFVHYDLEDQQTLNRLAANPAQFIAEIITRNENVVVPWADGDSA